MDLLSLQAIFSVDEIEDCGLHTKVLEARQTIANSLDSGARSLSEYGFTRSELAAMAEAKLRAHAETMRKVLFPDENSSVCGDDQDLGSKSMNVEEPET